MHADSDNKCNKVGEEISEKASLIGLLGAAGGALT
jgi:hypothetical protein